MSAEKIFPIRPHHGLCLCFFKGYGYSDKFTRNMAAVFGQLEKGAAVRLVNGADCICSACPNLDSGCPNAERYDRTVLLLCGLTAGQELTWQKLEERMRTHILAPGKLSGICGDCEWFSVCEKG